jgi:hypothetical protein
MTWFSRATQLSKDTTRDQGSDGSAKYINNKKCEFVICKIENNSVVSFKPFIDKINYTFEKKLEDATKELLGVDEKLDITQDSIYVRIEVGLNVVAHSINEAILNVKRINEVSAMYTSVSTKGEWETAPDRFLHNLYVISLNTLIGVNYDKGVKIDSKEKLMNYGVPGFLEKFDVSIDKSLGYFEYNKQLLPKKYNITFSFTVSNYSHSRLVGNEKFLWLPFYNEERLFGNDSQSFPLGIKNVSFGSQGSDGSFTYAKNKNSFIYFALGNGMFYKQNPKNDKGEVLKFKPFEFDVKKDITTDGHQLKPEPNRGGSFTMTPEIIPSYDKKTKLSFSILNHSINEAIYNTKQVQKLMRMFDTFIPSAAIGDIALTFPSGDPVDPNEKRIMVLFNGFISDGVNTTEPKNYKDILTKASPQICKSFSMEIDKDLGFFEYGGMLLCKKINITMELQSPYNITRTYKYTADYKGKTKKLGRKQSISQDNSGLFFPKDPNKIL